MTVPGSERGKTMAGEYGRTFIHGTGIGFQGAWENIINFKVDLGFALADTDETQKGDYQVHFKLCVNF